MKYNIVVLIALLTQIAYGQNKYEKESRIAQEQFPNTSYSLIQNYLADAKRVRFYFETNGDRKSYEAKFKKGKLHYSVEFDQNGNLEDVEFIIAEIDIPEDTWQIITDYLRNNFPKYRIKKIQQQHPLHQQNPKKTIHDALQNLILPYINYEVVFAVKENKSYQSYEALFNAEGQFVKISKSFPASYDHVLY